MTADSVTGRVPDESSAVAVLHDALPPREAVHDRIETLHSDVFEAVREWLRRPSFSDSGEGIIEGAAYTRELLLAVAPDARLVETAGNPIVLGTVAAADPDAPTLLIYGLYDVTPLVRDEWTFDPDQAPIVDASDIGVVPTLGPVLLGRGANNHKGPVLACIGAVQAMLDVGQRPAAHLIFVIEGEEEIGSPSMAGFVDQQRPLLARARGAWLPCMQQNSAGTMTLRRAFKGTVFAELECRGGEWGGTRDARHVWAGNSAWIDAPMMRLIKALGSLYSDDQRLTVDHLDERLRPPVTAESAEVQDLQAAFAANPHWEANMRRNLNVSRMLGGRPVQDHLPTYMLAATLNVQGVAGGYAGPSFYTNMPGWARAKLDFRFPAGVTPDEFISLVHAHLDARGHHMVRLTNARGYAASAELAEEDDTLLQAARITCERQGIPLAVWPIANNCCPASLLTELQRLEGGPPIPFSVAGAGHGDRAHAPDEYITVDSVRQLMHWTVDYLDTWAAIEVERARPSPELTSSFSKGVHMTSASDVPVNQQEDLGAMTGNVVRFGDLKSRPIPLMFIDSIIPGHQRHNYAVIGDTASENDSYEPFITSPHGFQIGMVRARQGNGPAYHTHDYIESFLPLRGRWRFYWGDSEDKIDGETILEEFDYITIPAKIWRGFECISEGESWIFAVLEKHEVYEGKDPYWAQSVIAKAREHGFEASENGKMIKPDNFAELEKKMLNQFGDEQ